MKKESSKNILIEDDLDLDTNDEISIHDLDWDNNDIPSAFNHTFQRILSDTLDFS